MCCPVCRMEHIKEPLLLIGKSSLCGFLSLSEWSFTICLTPYNHKYNVSSASLNKTFPSFLVHNNLGIQVVKISSDILLIWWWQNRQNLSTCEILSFHNVCLSTVIDALLLHSEKQTSIAYGLMIAGFLYKYVLS